LKRGVAVGVGGFVACRFRSHPGRPGAWRSPGQ
jgi:hypothetical protein